jgi:fibronectin-binding autotransporter adhesin
MKKILRETVRSTARNAVIRTLPAILLLTSLACASRAADIIWTNGTASYNNPLHWSPNVVPLAASSDNAINDSGTANVVLINPADPDWFVWDIRAGNAPGTSGAFEQNGRIVDIGGWFRLGIGEGSLGVYDLNAGTLDVTGGRINVGEFGTGILNIKGGTIIKTGDAFAIADGDVGSPDHPSTGTVNHSAGLVDSASELWIGNGFPGVNAEYNLSGTGQILVNNWFVTGRFEGTGRLNMTGGSITKGGGGATIIGDNGTGTFNQSAGSIITTPTGQGGEVWIGQNTLGRGTNNLSGTAVLNMNSWLAIGRENSIGELNISGNASVTKTGGGNIVIGTGGGVGGLGIINQNGGAITNTTSQVWLGENGVATGIWNLNNGVAVLGVLSIAHVASASGTFNLNGGSLTATQVRKGTGSGTATFNFNGGILRAAESRANFMTGLDLVDIQAGGAVIDTQDFDIGIPQTLYDYSSAGGGLTKNGSGTLTLTGNNGYGGMTTVNGGKLITSTATGYTGNYSVANGGGLGVIVTFPGGQLSPGSLTLGSSGPTSLDFDLGAHGNPSTAPLSVTGTLAVNGTVTVNIGSALPQLGQFPLVQYGNRTGSGTFVLGTLPVGVMAAIVNNTANNSIDLNITGVNLPRWDGQAGGNWDIGLTANWVNIGTGQPTTYGEGNKVLFDDNAQGVTTVNLVTTVNPGSVTANNSVLPYTLSGSGRISGPGGFTKQGTGTFAIRNTGGNTYSGPTRIEGDGTLSVTNLASGGLPSAIGSSSASHTNLVLAGGTLSYSGPAVSIDRGYSLFGTNNVIHTESNLILGGTVSPAPDSVFLKTGPATLGYTKVGTNLLANGGGGGFAAYNVVAGTLLLDGTAGPQTNYSNGEVWIGGTTESGASMVMSNSTLISSSWVALGRGNGSEDFLSSLRLENSTLRLTGGGFSAGYDAGLPTSLGISVLARQQITLNGNSALEVAAGQIFIAERRGSTATVLLNGNSRMTNSANAAIGVGVGGSITESSGFVQISDSAQWRMGQWFSIGHEGGTGTMLIKDNGSLFTGSDLNVTDVGASTGTLTVQDNASVFANNIYVGKDNAAAGVFTITNNATVESGNGLTMARHWQGHTVVPTTAIVNLAGGSLAVNLVQGSLLEGTPYGTFNFNGGRLIARNPIGENFMFDLAEINVLAGGAVIDSHIHNISIAQPLLNGGGGGGLTKLGSGALFLNGANTYTGPTVVSAGSLGGIGSISGPVTVGAGGTLRPGTLIGTLMINNSLSLSGTTLMEISRDSGTPESDRVAGVTTLTYGGTLIVTNIGSTALQVGDTFQLFSAATINPATFSVLNLPAGYSWDTSQLNVNGSIRVSAVTPAQPEFNPPAISDGNLVLSGSGGAPGASYTVLSSMDAAAPLNQWTQVATGTFDATGGYSNAIPINQSEPRRFYLIRIP